MSAYIFDVETTGRNDPEIIEAAWLRLGKGQRIEGQYRQLFKPNKPIEMGAMATHHILECDLIEAPPSSSFTLPDDMDCMIGHNIDYDWKLAGSPDIPRICTLALSKVVYPSCDSYTLSSLIYYITDDKTIARESLKNAHSALHDCKNTLVLLIDIIQKLGTKSWAEIYQKSEDARMPTAMSFGKHKGVSINELPIDYVMYLLKQDELDPYLKLALQNRGN